MLEQEGRYLGALSTVQTSEMPKHKIRERLPSRFTADDHHLLLLHSFDDLLSELPHGQLVPRKLSLLEHYSVAGRKSTYQHLLKLGRVPFLNPYVLVILWTPRSPLGPFMVGMLRIREIA